MWDKDEYDKGIANGGNGIGCPSCGEMLHDVSDDWDKDGYECRHCEYTGWGV